tara:strand:- start:119 stop:727 length:609 start_codon:yes stop_codon:yes gene_type:complete
MKVIIPQDLNEITLGQMMELNRIDKLELEQVERAKLIIKLLVENVNDNNIDQIKVADLLVMYKKLCAMTNTQTKLIKKVSIEGKTYGFNPDLNNISTGEFMDIDTYCKDLDKNLHLIMAVLYREITKEAEGKYKILEYDGEINSRAELFKNKMPGAVAQSCVVFFYNLGSSYLTDMLQSLKEDNQIEKELNLVRNGGGTLSL